MQTPKLNLTKALASKSYETLNVSIAKTDGKISVSVNYNSSNADSGGNVSNNSTASKVFEGTAKEIQTAIEKDFPELVGLITV